MANQISIHFSCRSSRWLLGLMIVQWMTLSFTGWEVIWLVCELWYEIERKFSVVLNEEHALPKLYFLSLKHCWLPTIVSHSRRSTYTCFQEDPFLKTAHREFKALGGNFHFQNLMGRAFSHQKTQKLKSEGSQLVKRVKSSGGVLHAKKKIWMRCANESISSGTMSLWQLI